TIAANACILLLGVEHDYFSRVQSILVYPTGYRSGEGWVGPDGVVHEDIGQLGEAWYGGPAVLAREAVRPKGSEHRGGQNAVLHEFAHQLDYLDGVADGTPALWNQAQYQTWHKVMSAEYDRLVAESERGTPKVLDEYGATDPVEFFAVATECFFEKPVALRRHRPALYQVLSEYYCQDPVRWFEPHAESAPAPAVPADRVPAKDTGRPYRGSRAARRSAAAAAQEMATWPRWVRLWNVHPGQPKDHAQTKLVNLSMMIGIVILAFLLTLPDEFGLGWFQI